MFFFVVGISIPLVHLFRVKQSRPIRRAFWKEADQSAATGCETQRRVHVEDTDPAKVDDWPTKT